MNPTPEIPPSDGCNAGGDSPRHVVILGIGNVLWADEGFGVRCVERIQQEWEFGPEVEIIDGGTQGLYLIHHVQGADALLIFDAIDWGYEPGTLMVARDGEVPAYMGAKKMSLHQTGFQEVLALAQFTGKFPEKVALVGCQPEQLEDYGGSLRPSIKAVLPEAIERGLALLRDWGVAMRPRTTPLSEQEAVTLPHLRMDRYEAERPSEEDACRTGDSRFMPARA
ncbi:HyaD/HybD family hydrogenase maturation endopeptidase [Derxia gummosa]|uniref:HyaD/HybD family hydrogenase maturation endopeptidase n=1 Tax=Derxia gummosa DSM 723 TaxID=1121388 RepID=A0A8B6X0U6_9BURK|nr:HyaD/HybD family hydrogenase maturation endopeptidase [Derxia gummosa]